MLVQSVVLVSVLLVVPVLSHESFLGRCPSAPAMDNFNMSKFEGLWYMAENFNKDFNCVTWNITKGKTPFYWTLTEAMESGAFHAVGLDHASYHAAALTMPDPNEPSKLRLRWPISIAGDSAFTVHVTDYDRFAGIFECQNVGLFHRQNGVVLSRTPILKTELKQMARIRTDDIKVEYYQNVKQGNCKYKYRKQNQGEEDEDIEDIPDIEVGDLNPSFAARPRPDGI